MNGIAVKDQNARYVYKNRVVQLTDLRVPEQGAPMIGSLIINGNNIFRRVNYAAPFLFHEDHLFLPMARQKQNPIKFSICAINLRSFEISVNPEMYDRIFLNEIRKNWILFSTSEQSTRMEHMDLFWVQ